MTFFKTPELLFGTTAGPLHKGHLHVINHVRRATNIQPVQVLVTPGHNLKAPLENMPFHHRLEIARLMTAHDNALHVSDFEANLTINDEEGRTFTVLEEWRKAHPTKYPVWVMGADSWETFHLWGGAVDMIATTPMLVVNRGEVDSTKTEAAKRFAHLHQPHFSPTRAGWTVRSIPPHPASSSAIREAFLAGEISPYLTPEAATYMREHNLLTI